VKKDLLICQLNSYRKSLRQSTQVKKGGFRHMCS